MSSRLTATLLFALLAYTTSSAFAQDEGGMSFGEDEVGEVQEASPVEKFLTEGKKLYEQGKFVEAALIYQKVLGEDDVTAESYWPEAEYEIAKTLFRLELYQGALNAFGRIVDSGEEHPFFLPSLRGLVLLTEAIPEDPALMERLAAYQPYYPNEVPEKYRDRFAYLVGRHLYNQLDVEGALSLLDKVSPRSPDYTKARYIAGVSHVANYDAQPAVRAFKDVLRFLTAKKDEGELKPEEKRLLETTYLAMARVFYSTGQYDTSLTYYGRIDRNSENWPVALFESSWAYFQLDLYNKALGNLHSLNSPFFSDRYFPEGPILSGVLFFYNCRYDRVRDVLEDFIYEYEPVQKEVEIVAARYGEDPEAMYRWLINAKNEGTEIPELQQVVATALDDKQIRNKLNLILAIDKEIELLNGMPDAFKSSKLGLDLMQESELARSFAKSDAGTIAVQRLERVVRELQDLTIEQKKILFEVERAERGEIQADLRAELSVAEKVEGGGTIEVSDEEIYWTFDGEYWRDELGFYLFNTTSQCKR
jgi:tetratricopeptide (TPR) repeat protein